MRLCLIVLVFMLASAVEVGVAAINVTLEGKWAGKTPDGTKVSYDFSTDGSVTWEVDEEHFREMFPHGLKGKYQIRVADPVWQIDIAEFEHPEFKRFKFLGLIAIIDAKSLRMEERPGERPKQFGSEAVVFRAGQE